MSKVKLSLDSKDRISFKRAVAIPTPDGSPLTIEFEFKHRTRTEFAKLMDEHIAKVRAATEVEREPGASISDAVAEAIQRDVGAVMDVASGWNVDGLAFNADSLTKVIDQYPGAAMAIVTDYRISLTEGRLGN